MGYKNLDDIRVELGLPTKGTHKPQRGNYTNISLHFRITEEQAKEFLLRCEKEGMSESLFTRRLLLANLGQLNRE